MNYKNKWLKPAPSEELKQASQQHLEAGQHISSLQVDRDKVTLEVVKEKKKNTTTMTNLGQLRDELAQYKASEEEQWEARKKEFLKSFEFYELLGGWSSFLFDCGFTGAVKQFKKVRYSSEGIATDFLDPDVTLAEILDALFKDWYLSVM